MCEILTSSVSLSHRVDLATSSTLFSNALILRWIPPFLSKAAIITTPSLSSNISHRSHNVDSNCLRR
eukprot:CAMPEP_0179208534 /NCGR_PEP_ID=MMETSP0796-20121207/103998_1 /TAXON_ID=73915 /ORGANISM="Pyrodinium bahamense, Strain pbaha01" /LENGTH=66 /DNA_ID=CAMNT_0020913485 /DNA_START=398 /DNA_END=595 /DNA_ORIENTATION=-